MSRLVPWLVLLALWACGGDAPSPSASQTQIALRLTASEELAAQARHLTVRTATLHEGRFTQLASADIDVTSSRWPVHAQVVPGPGRSHDSTFELVATARDEGGAALAEARIITRFSPNEEHVVPLHLAACGEQAVCEPDAQCHGYACLTCEHGTGKCVNTPVDPRARLDAAPSDVDAGQPLEGAMRADAAMDSDAGADAGEHAEGGAADAGALEDPFRLKSRYFAHDEDALAVLRGESYVLLPTSTKADDWGLAWRVANAMRMLGSEPRDITTGSAVDAQRLRQLDRDLVEKERLLDESVSRLPDYRDIWAPDFKDNVPQAFAVHQVATLMELFNTRGALPKLQRFSNDCVLANILPGMCSALLDFGTSNGRSCQDVDAEWRDPQIVQWSDFFGFGNVRNEIAASDLPAAPTIESTCWHVGVLMSAFVSEIGSGRPSFYDAVYPRDEACGGQSVAFFSVGSPFRFTGEPGTQSLPDFVSTSAAGLNHELSLYDPQKDVEQTVMAYVLFPEYLRERVAASQVLSAKYEFIRERVFGGVQFSNPHLIGPFVAPGDMVGFCYENPVRTFRIESIRPLPQ